MDTRRLAVVFSGGGLGALARFIVASSLAPGALFPLSILVINCLGSALLGAVFVLADEAGLMRTTTRLFLAVGVLGGFTTFSTFAWGAAALAGEHHPAVAALYVLVTVGAGLLSVLLGMTGARQVVRVFERPAGSILTPLQGECATGSPARDMDLIETEDRDESA